MENEYEYRGQRRAQLAVARTFKLVYGWMTLGLIASGAMAWYAFQSGLALRVLSGFGMWGCILGELALVWVLSSSIRKIPVPMAILMFMGYALLNGLTLSIVFYVYELPVIQNVFYVTAGMFAGLAIYGTVTDSDLSGVGAFCGMALWGLIIASLLNFFLGSSRLDWIVSFAGILIFSGLTMYDAQKIRELALEEGTMSNEAVQKVGILGALSLYLDFVNLFLYLLRFFGRDE